MDGHDDRCEAWVAAYDNVNGYAGGGDDWMLAMAVDPDGDLVYITGESWDDTTGSYDITTQAVNGATGAQVWLARYDSDRSYDRPSAVEVAPDGETVIVTGLHRAQEAVPSDMITIAYDADTGTELWTASFDGADGDAGSAATFDTVEEPDGRERLVTYVVGYTHGVDSFELVTIAYDVRTGSELWSSTHGDGAAADLAADSIVSADGKVLIAGTRWTASGGDFAVVAYEAADIDHRGEELWTISYDGGLGRSDELVDMEVSADGDTAYVIGTADRAGSSLVVGDSDIHTVALDTTAGGERWKAAYSGTTGGLDYAYDLEVGPKTGAVYVTGVASTDHRRSAIGVVSYDGTTGERGWDARGIFVWGQGGIGITIAPDESSIYVAAHAAAPQLATATGVAGVHLAKADFTTIAYAADDGAQEWSARHSTTGPRMTFDLPYGIGIAPDGERVYVAGVFGNRGDTTGNPLNGWNVSNDFGTIAYDT